MRYNSTVLKWGAGVQNREKGTGRVTIKEPMRWNSPDDALIKCPTLSITIPRCILQTRSVTIAKAGRGGVSA